MAGHVVKVSVQAHTKQFSKAFANLGSEMGLDKLASGARRAAGAVATIGAAAATAAAGLGIKAVQLAGNLEQSTGAIEQVFKASGDQMKAFADKASTSVGLSKNQFQELATVLGSQLKNGGTSIDELGSKTNDLITLGADMASMFGGTTADAVGALSSALKGERDPIERYGVTLKQAMIDAKATELGFADVSSAQAQQAATIALIMEQTADAQGNFARESGTFAHQVQVAKARLTDLATSIGERLLPAATTVATWFNDHVIPALEQTSTALIDRAGPAFDRLAAWITGTALPALQNLAAWLHTDVLPVLQNLAAWITGTLIPALGAALGWINQHKTAIAAVLAPILAIATAWQTFLKVQALVRAGQAAWNSIVTIGKGIQAAYAFGTYGQITAERGFAQAAAGTAGALRTKTAALAQGIAGMLRSAASTVASTASLVAHKVAVGASAAAQWALNAAMSANPIALVVVAIAALVAALVVLYQRNETVRNALNAAWDVIKGAIGAVADWISGTAIPAITTAISRLGQIPGQIRDWFGRARDWAVDRLNALINDARALPGRVIAGLSALGSMLWSSMYGHFQNMVTAATTVAATLFGFVSSIPGRIQGALSGLGSLLWSAGSSIIQGLLDGLRARFEAVKSFVGGIADWIAAHKGPLSYDAVLLKPAGEAIMEGLRRSMAGQIPRLQTTLDQVTATIQATSATLSGPTITAARPQQAAPTIVVQCLEPTLEVGRKIAEAIALWERMNGGRR